MPIASAVEYKANWNVTMFIHTWNLNYYSYFNLFLTIFEHLK